MPSSASDNQRPLLNSLSQMGGYGRAEGEDKGLFPKTFYPIAEHLRAFDPDVVLVVGPRGAGKTELFRAGIELKLLPEIATQLSTLRLPPLDKTDFVQAYPIAREFPDGIGLKKFFNAEQNGQKFVPFWFAYLVRTLSSRLPGGASELTALTRPAGGDFEAVLKGFNQCGVGPLTALDRLDEQLEQKQKFLFVGYDELDLLGDGDWKTMNAAVQGLVGFWSSRSRRWRRIRAKIFLRTDLYERAGMTSGADFAKLAANRAEINWSDAALYGMLVKRIANSASALSDYCTNKITFTEDRKLGQIPKMKNAMEARPLIEKMVGPFMGANANKGLAFKWLLDHIRDGRGHALPRALVRLIERAAKIQADSGRLPRWPRLLEPRSLRRALDDVSMEHLNQSKNEWPWLEGLKERLKAEHEVPWERKRVQALLSKNWDASWGGEGQSDVHPPAENAHELVDYLVEVGIFRERSGGRVDVPDLFLKGLGLSRRGGVISIKSAS